MSKSVTTKGSFLPANYRLPDKAKQFMKLEPGDNVIRFLTPPLRGFVFFSEDNKPVRRKYDETSQTLGDFTSDELEDLKAKKDDKGQFEGSRHFWIALVWDRKTDTPKILEITQTKILKPLYGLVNDEDWGDPRSFDVNIVREGSGKLDTEYTVNPKPHKPLTKEIQSVLAQLEESRLLDLEAIWDGGYPFEKYIY